MFSELEGQTDSVVSHIETGPMQAWPSSIELHKKSRTLEISWAEVKTVLTHRQLRLSCRCAECESGRRKNLQAVVPDDVELLKLELVADAGLRFFFSDGHDRGIFPWPYLFRLAFARP